MAHGPAGVTIHKNEGEHQNENEGVHQTAKNAGVHQIANTHSPYNDHNDPHNEFTIKTENTTNVTGNKNEAEDDDANEAENKDENEHKDLKKALCTMLVDGSR